MNEKSYSNSYKEAGVDVTAGYKAVELMKEHVKRTNIRRLRRHLSAVFCRHE